MAVGDSCLCCAFLPPDRLHTRVRVLRLSSPVPLVATGLVPPLTHSAQRLCSDPYRGPGFYTLFTTLLPMLLAGVPSTVSNSAFLNIGFVFACGSAELPTQDPVLESQATSSLPLMLQPGSLSSAMITPSTNVVSKMPQTMRDTMLASRIVLFSL